MAICGLGLSLASVSVWSAAPVGAQSSQAKPAAPRSGGLMAQFLDANAQAVQVRAGNRNAMVNLSHHIFLQVGLTPEIADSFHFTQRLVQSEADYRSGAHPAVHEQDIVTAVNNLSNSLGGPSYTRTTQAEVRHLRMESIVRYPQLLVSHEGPDSKGHYSALSDDMSPSEAVLIGSLMVYQKINNPEYQMTTEEKESAPTKVQQKAITNQRMAEMDDLMAGRTRKVDVLTLVKSADNFLSDLKIDATLRPEFDSISSSEGAAPTGHAVTPVNQAVAQKGGR